MSVGKVSVPERSLEPRFFRTGQQGAKPAGSVTHSPARIYGKERHQRTVVGERQHHVRTGQGPILQAAQYMRRIQQDLQIGSAVRENGYGDAAARDTVQKIRNSRLL